MRVTVDQDRCCSSGFCVLSAPEVFDQRDEDGVVVVVLAEPPQELHAATAEAVAQCPTGAILLAE